MKHFLIKFINSFFPTNKFIYLSWKNRVWEIQLFRTTVINNFQHANSSTFTEQVDCKRWNLSWPNFTNYCFNKQIHLLFLTRTDCKRQRHPSPHSLTSIFKKQIHIRLLKNRVYEIKQFFTKVIKWFFQKAHSFYFIETQIVRDETVLCQLH